jgi:hypothetical protein
MRSMGYVLGLILGIFLMPWAAWSSEAPTFSSLPIVQQDRMHAMVEPPPLAQRYGCYSTPMYYLMYSGYGYDGINDKDPSARPYLIGKPGPDWGHWKLDRNRPDWQEAMVRDWVDLGLNNTHLDIYPLDNGLKLPADYLKAIEDYATLSAKYGLKVGVRLDPLGGTELWELHPNNPNNQRQPYLAWVKRIVETLKGKTAYYVLGDEMTLHEPASNLAPKAWTPQQYLDYFKQVSAVIKGADPSAKVSMFAASSGEWFNVLYLLKNGYAHYGDAVAINFYDYGEIPKFFDDARRLAPGLMFLSNGVGYCSNGLVSPRYPQGDPYSKLPTEEAHGNAIAKNMFAWWDLGASTAPYYLSLRQWVIEGKVYPSWFGFFGFEDYLVDHGSLTVKRYPGWYAYQTITHTFYNRSDFKTPPFAIDTSRPLSMFRAYEHAVQGGSELLLMLWNDKATITTTVKIKSSTYRYPVRVNTFDYHQWSDVRYEVTPDTLNFDINVGPELVIVRLIREE